MRTRPELALIVAEVAAAVAAVGVAVAAARVLWPIYLDLPAALQALIAAAPLGAAARLALASPYLLHGARALHATAAARLLATATNRRGQHRDTRHATTGNGHDPHI